jgi:adenylyl-sulfate kinase
MTGLSGSGKSSIAHCCEQALVASGQPAYVLDGDNIRHGLCRDLGFSRDDRGENARRAAEVAQLMADAGTVVLVALISPYAVDRKRARQVHEGAGLPFVEVWVSTPLVECERRDPKGLYERARSGSLRDFTSVTDPYEAPERPDLEVTTVGSSVEAASAAVLQLIQERIL